MFKRWKKKPKETKLVWRISAAAPLGEYVNPEDSVPRDAQTNAADSVGVGGAPGADDSIDQTAPQRPEHGWHQSSHDLLSGVEMTEEPLDQLPREIFDGDYKKRR